MYHDLAADAIEQKNALLNEEILLSPWELLVMTLFKTLQESSFVPHLEQYPLFISDIDQKEKSRQRLDKHRLLTIVMTRLLNNLMEKSKDQVKKPASDPLLFFYYAFDEYCLQPVINWTRGQRYTPMNTPRLEFVYMFLSLAMNPDNSFNEPSKAFPQQHYHGLSSTIPVWDYKGPLQFLKPKLYHFFKAAFYLSASEFGDQVRFCDLA
jgi:hypothetical protein